MIEEGHRVEWVGRTVVVRAVGAIDMLTAPALHDTIQNALTRGPAALIIDLTAVDFLASAGMLVLVDTHGQIAPAVRFAVVADGPATSRPLKITGLTELLALFGTLESALDQVGQPPE